VVVADGQTPGNVLRECCEVTPDAWRIGSSASKRVARAAARIPTHSAERWSTATNTTACPSPVQVTVKSVPHISFTRLGMMVASWLRGPRGAPTREGASSPCSRISRKTRRLDVRTPAMRNRAQSLRWPSP